MKTEHVPLVVALIAAASSIAAVAYTQYASLRLEREKWERSQLEQHHKALVDAIVNYGRDLAVAIQRADVLTWTAKNDPDAITAAVLAEHDKAAQVALATLSANRLTLFAQDSSIAARVDSATVIYYRIDECIAKAAALHRKDKQQSTRKLGECADVVADSWKNVFAQFRTVLEGISLVPSTKR